MITFILGDVFFDIDLSFLLEKNREIISNRLEKRIVFAKNIIGTKRIKIIFKEMSRFEVSENLEQDYEKCNGTILEIKNNLSKLVIKTGDGYYLKYSIDINRMELFVFFEEAILARDLNAFSLTLGGLDYALLNIFLVKYDHLIVHSSAFIYKEAAFLFLGHSGYGKSTIYNIVKNNIEEIVPLCEDRNILYLKDGVVYLANFWREFVSTDNKYKFYNYTAKLKKAFFIEKSETNAKDFAEIKLARLKIFNTFFRFSDDKAFINEATALIFNFTAIFNNFYSLKFTKDAKFITFIKQEIENEI